MHIFKKFLVFILVSILILVSSQSYDLTETRIRKAFSLFNHTSINSSNESSNLKYGVVYPEGPDMDFSFVAKSLIRIPQMQFYPYPYMSPQKDSNSSPSINRIPVNKGKEAMVYLSFIIQYYDRLPDKILFVHGHATSKHQKAKLADIITHLNWDKIESYFSIRNCGKHQFIDPHDKLDKRSKDNFSFGRGGLESQAFVSFLNEFNFSRYGLEIEEKINMPGCCAQFVVTKADVLRNSILFYKELREWLISTDMNDFYSGRMFEYTWHWFFTGAPKLDRRNECKNLISGYINQ